MHSEKNPEKNILEFVDSDDRILCTGCGGCFNICPHDAIIMEPDDEGFLFPSIKLDLCTNCGLCLEVCPPLHLEKNNNLDLECYAVWAKEELRIKSTSGGAFSVFAMDFLERGGAVCGVGYNKDFSVHHTLIESPSDLDLLRKSKYLQSDKGLIYKQVRAKLKEGKPVLFSGCPCEGAGLRLFLGKDYPNLIIVDVICHGVPSPKVFSNYLEEKFGIDNVLDYQFRLDGDECGWGELTAKVVLRGHEKRYIKFGDNKYFQGFINSLFLRQSCTNCQFATPPHMSDITLGDFWGISDYDPSLDDGKGTSAVIINTKKGKDYFESNKKSLVLCKEVPIKLILPNNLSGATNIHPQRQKFMALEKEKPFSKAVHFTLDQGFNVGIIGIYSMANFGSQLTYYSLYRFISDLGYQVSMIERPMDSIWKTDGIPSTFYQDPYEIGSRLPLFSNKREMTQLNSKGDIFVLGSDIMLNYEMYKLTGYITYLDYIQSNKTLIAYATSFGKETECPQSEIDRLRFYLHRFNAISVREDSGVEICKTRLGVEAVQTLDPVFIVDKKHFDLMIEKSTKKVSGDFILFYLLDLPDDINPLKQFAEKNGKKMVLVLDADYYLNKSNQLIDFVEQDVRAEDLLNFFEKASFVVTDSFHGICFSLIYHKNFIALENNNRGTTRMTSLLNLLGLIKNCIPNINGLMNFINNPENIDYFQVDAILAEKIDDSRHWLEKALLSERTNDLSDFDLIKEMTDTVNERLEKLEKRIQENDKWNQLVGDTFAAVHDRFEKTDELTRKTEEELEIIKSKQNTQVRGKEREKTNNNIPITIINNLKSLKSFCKKIINRILHKNQVTR